MAEAKAAAYCPHETLRTAQLCQAILNILAKDDETQVCVLGGQICRTRPSRLIYFPCARSPPRPARKLYKSCAR